MIVRLLAQLILTTVFLHALPHDGASLEAAAGLPVAGARSSELIALQMVSENASLASTSGGPTNVDSLSLGIVTSAQSVLVMDAQSGAVLYEKNPLAVRSIGSITKLMTALVFLQTQPDLTATVTLTDADIREGGRLYLAPNDPVTLQDVLKASLIGSDNSATAALVRLSGIDETNFVSAMNAKASGLHMSSTHFVEPTGLSSENRSTTYDLTRLVGAAMDNATIQQLTTTAHVTVTQQSGRKLTIDSTDNLLETFVNAAPFSVRVGKTGYLPEAGYCIALVAYKEGQGSVYVVLLGSDSIASRIQEVKGLIDWTYRVWSWN